MVTEEATQEETPWRVTFFPPLFDQRRMWVLSKLRQEEVASVLDVGCGEGQLLECLVRAPPHLRPRPQDAPPSEMEQYIHLDTVHGFDISAPDLVVSIEVTTPASQTHEAQSWLKEIRWEDLVVQIWKGGLEVPNPVFEGIECIVAMEVIEHLPPSVFPFFAPVLLGKYHPRLLLVTTPNYTFNARFRPVGSTGPWGTPDPTRRTTRDFRHPDHKFEWTTEECNAWCQAAAEAWGYDVEVSGVGRAQERDPWGRDEASGFASQVACFRRREGEEYARARRARWEIWIINHGADGPPHELLVTQMFKAHPLSGKPASLERIGTEVTGQMQQWRDKQVYLRELWREENISALCGGWQEVLAEAVERHEYLALHRVGRDKDDWKVEWVGAEWEEGKGLWDDYDNASPLPVEQELESSSDEEVGYGSQEGWSENERGSREGWSADAAGWHNAPSTWHLTDDSSHSWTSDDVAASAAWGDTA